MADTLHILTVQSKSRIYKFSIFAPSKVVALEHCHRLLNLYTNHVGPLAEIKLKDSLSSNMIEEARDREDFREAKLLSQKSLDLTTYEYKELRGDELYNNGVYYNELGQRFGSPYVSLGVLDKENKTLLAEYRVECTKFDDEILRIANERQKCNPEYQATEITHIRAYVQEFFQLHPKEHRTPDLVKMMEDMVRLHTTHIVGNGIDLSKASQAHISESNKIYDFITLIAKKNLQEVVETYPFNIIIAGDDGKDYNPAADLPHESINKTLNSSLMTPLMFTVAIANFSLPSSSYSMRVSKSLLDQGANVNEQDAFGRTALMYAAVGYEMLPYSPFLPDAPSRGKLVQLLLDAGADVMIRDKDGRTALDHFKIRYGNNHPTVAILEVAVHRRRAQAQENQSLGSSDFFAPPTPAEAMQSTPDDIGQHFKEKKHEQNPSSIECEPVSQCQVK